MIQVQVFTRQNRSVEKASGCLTNIRPGRIWHGQFDDLLDPNKPSIYGTEALRQDQWKLKSYFRKGGQKAVAFFCCVRPEIKSCQNVLAKNSSLDDGSVVEHLFPLLVLCRRRCVCIFDVVK